MIRGKNTFGREHVIATREVKRGRGDKREEVIRWDNEYE